MSLPEWDEREVPELDDIDESEYENLFIDQRKTSTRLRKLVENGDADESGPSKYLRNYTGASNYVRVPRQTSHTQRGTATREEAPDPPMDQDSLDLSDHASYLCRYCHDRCLNPVDSKAVKTNQCWNCLSLPTAEEDLTRFLSVFGPDSPARPVYHPVAEFDFVERRQDYTPSTAFVIAQQIRLNGEETHPRRHRPGSKPPGSETLETTPQDQEPEAAPLPWGADPEARSQGPTEGTDPTTKEPQRRLSDSETYVRGGSDV